MLERKTESVAMVPVPPTTPPSRTVALRHGPYPRPRMQGGAGFVETFVCSSATAEEIPPITYEHRGMQSNPTIREVEQRMQQHYLQHVDRCTEMVRNMESELSGRFRSECIEAENLLRLTREMDAQRHSEAEAALQRASRSILQQAAEQRLINARTKCQRNRRTVTP